MAETSHVTNDINEHITFVKYTVQGGPEKRHCFVCSHL